MFQAEGGVSWYHLLLFSRGANGHSRPSYGALRSRPCEGTTGGDFTAFRLPRTNRQVSGWVDGYSSPGIGFRCFSIIPKRPACHVILVGA